VIVVVVISLGAIWTDLALSPIRWDSNEAPALTTSNRNRPVAVVGPREHPGPPVCSARCWKRAVEFRTPSTMNRPILSLKSRCQKILNLCMAKLVNTAGATKD
jgi:hypothetical protein